MTAATNTSNTSAPSSRNLTLSYETRSSLVTKSDATALTLALDTSRGQVGLSGVVRKTALLRDALLTASAILGSDLRYKAKDRTAYLAYLMKQGKKANAAIWEAQKAYLDRMFVDEVQKNTVLDPILTVHPDELSLEVFSQDESAYARLSINNNVIENRTAAHGTACVDLSPELLAGMDRLRSFAPVELDVHSQFAPNVEKKPEKRDISVPYTWMRGFLQVQSAATLPAASCELAPIDLYNLLFLLRSRKAKTSPRGLRFELVPGCAPRLVVEPWEYVIECHGPVYTGNTPRVVRTFGRQRLLTFARALPHLKRVQVRLLGPGLPVFWFLDMGDITLSVALTGWTESGWASAASFDTLMPKPSARALAEQVRQTLVQRGPTSHGDLQKITNGSAEDVRAAVQLECVRGHMIYDAIKGVYRPRQLLNESIDDNSVRYNSPREAKALRLLGGEAGDETPALKADLKVGDVTITKLHQIGGEGIEIHGEVNDREALRSFSPRFLIDVEGRVREAWCSCSHFRRAGMREGPCEHMIALRIAYSRHRVALEALRQTEEGRKTIRAETRTYMRRDSAGKETVYTVSLDGSVVHVHWGLRNNAPRHQRMWFDSDADARDAYFARLNTLAAEGYIDADAMAQA